MANMPINSRSAHRYSFKCTCCQTRPGKDRKQERRNIKRRERQNWKKNIERH